MGSRRRCCCNRCSVTVVMPDYENASQVANPSPPPDTQSPDHRETPAWGRDERPVIGDCTGTFKDWNCYIAADPATSTTRTQDVRGQKLAQSLKAHHGRLPFGWCPVGCTSEPAHYLSISRTATLSWLILTFNESSVETGRDEQTGDVYAGTGTVARDSGIRTLSGCTEPTIDPVTEYPENVAHNNYPKNWAGIERGCAINISNYPESGSTEHASFTAMSAAYAIDDDTRGEDETGSTIVQTLVFTATGSTHIAGVLTYDKTDYSMPVGGPPVYVSKTTHVEVNFDIEMSNEYTAAQLVDDVVTPVGNWDLSNNSYFKFSTSVWRALAAQCRHDEASPTSCDLGTSGCDYEDTNEFTGSIIGSPFTGGLANWSFGFDHITYEYDAGWLIQYYGAKSGEAGIDSTDGDIDTSATVWTSNYHAGADDYWPGYGCYHDGGQMILQKGLEILEPYPSFNFFRSDRWLLDTGVYSNGTTAVTTAEITTIVNDDEIECADLTGTISAGQLVGIRGGDLDGQVRRVASISGTGMTFEAIVTTPGDPDYGLAEASNYTAAAYTAALWDSVPQVAGGRVGKLRFQYDRGSGDWWPMKVGITGRVAITAAYDSGTGKTTFTLATAQNLISEDRIDVLNSSNAGISGATNLEWTRIDSTSGTVDGDKTTGAAWLKNTGAPYYGWNEIHRYGDFVVQSTVSEIQEVEGENVRVDVVTNSNANAGTGACPIIVCTPNDDAPTGSTSIGFPSGTMMSTCGGRDWKYIRQSMVDPVWQEPVGDGAFTDCPLIVEARITVRSGTRDGETCPTLPANCAFTVPATSPAGAGWTDSTPNGADCPWFTCV